MFDTLRYAKQLEETGVPRNQAETHIQIMSDVIEILAATRDDVKSPRLDTKDLKSEMSNEFKSTRGESAAEFRAVRAEMASEFSAVRAEMAAEFRAVRAEMAAGFSAVRSEMEAGFSSVRAEMASELKDIRHEMARMETRLLIKLAAVNVTTITLMLGALAAFTKLTH